MERVSANIYKDDELLAKEIVVTLQLDKQSRQLPVWRGEFESNAQFDMRMNPYRVEISDGRKGEINIISQAIDVPSSYEFVAIEDIA